MPTGRSRSTAIYFLLARGERSHWHRIDAVEVWHYYAGSALTLRIADDDGAARFKLGANLAAGEQPQAIVPPHTWQAAESTGDWTLVGCTVAPGFDSQHSRWRRRIGSRLIRRVGKALRAHHLVARAIDGHAALCPPYGFAPHHILRRDQSAAGDQDRGNRDSALGLAKPARIRNAVESSGVA